MPNPTITASEELKAKLRVILDSYANAAYLESEENGPDPDLEGHIAQIDQAYRDEGYLTPQERVAWHDEHFRDNHMTGQEWYDRFEKLLTADSYVMTYNATYVLKAAKKAAGL